MANLAALSVQIDAQTAIFDRKINESANALYRKFDASGKSAAQSVAKLEGQFARTSGQIERSVSGMTTQFSRVQAAAVGLFSVAAITQFSRGLAATADGYANVTAKLNLVSNGSKDLSRNMEQVFAISQRTYSSLDSTATLASRTQRALVSNGTDAADAMRQSLQLTETIQKAFAVSGATQAEAANAIVQLSQGLAAGALRGEEYNSVAEQGSRITQALAAHLGVTTGELRNMAKEGKITAEVLTQALSAQSSNIAAEFEKLPLTISRSTQLLENAWTKYIGDADQASGVSRAIADSIAGVGRNLDPIISGMTALAGATALAFGGRALQGIGEYTNGLVKAAAAQSGMIEMERLAATAAVETAQAKAADLTRTLEVTIAAREQVLAKKALADTEAVLAARHLEAAKAAGVQSFALREQAAATERLALAQARQRALITEMAVLGQQQARIQSGIAEASAAQIAAQGRLAGALTTTQVVMQGLSKAGGALFTMIGGWPTIALAAAYGLYKLWEAVNAGDPALKAAAETLEAYNKQVETRNRLAGIQQTFGVGSQEAAGIDAFVKLQNESKRVAENIEMARARIVELSRSASEASSGQILNLQKRIESLGRQLEENNQKIVDFSSVIENLPASMQGAIRSVQDFAAAAARMFGDGTSSPAAKAAEFTSEAAKMVESLTRERETLGLSRAQLIMYNAAKQAQGEASQELRDKLMQEAGVTAQLIMQHEANEKAMRASTGATRDFAKEAERAAKEQQKLRDAVAAGMDRMSGMADSHNAPDDPREQAELQLADAMKEVSRAAEEEAARIEELRQLTGDNAAATEQLAFIHGEAARAIDGATLARDRSIAAIEAERDVTGRFLRDLSAETRLIGVTVSQRRVEETVLRAVAEAKRLNAAAGKEVAKVDEDQIRRLAKINEAMELAMATNEKSPLFEMIDQAKELGEAMKEAIKEGMDPALLKPIQDAIAKTNAQIKVDSIGSFKALLGAVQTFTKEGSSGFKNIERGMAALSIIQDVIALKAAVTAVLTQGQGDPYSAFARMAAMAAAVAPFIASIGVSLASLGGGSGGPSSSSAEVRQVRQGTGTILGDAEAKSESIANAMDITAKATSELVGINRGMLNALQTLNAGLSSAGVLLARGAGDVEFGAIKNGFNLDIGGKDPITSGISNLLLGGKKKIIDQGIVIAGGALNDMLQQIVVGAYQTIKTSGGLFGGGGTNDRIQDITGDVGKQFQLIIGSIVDTVREGALALGLVPAEVEAAIAAFKVEEIRISLKDLSAEEQQAELAAVFSSLFDGLAGAVVPFIAQFQKVGEGLGETLVRVATGVQVTQEAVKQLGFSLNETDPEKFAQISEGLIDLAGGIEGFIEGMNSFMSNFATDAHKLQVATDAINSAFDQAGLSVPATADGMWALMQTFDATTEEGREQIATLLRLSGVAKQYYDLLEKAEEARLDYAKQSADLKIELGIGSEFVAARTEVEQWASETIKQMNDLARAAGRAGASEQDLVNVHSVAAQRIAKLIQALKKEVEDLAVQLGYMVAGDTLESLNAQIESLQSSSQYAADGISSAVDTIRQQMDLLLGDLSPYNDQKKLELALQGLREGTVDPQQVLEIGRRLYASTSNYTRLFEQVMGMASFGAQTGGTNSASIDTGDGRSLAQLIAARDAMLEAQRPELADQLARRLAELSVATGDEFADLAEGMGWTLDRLAEDLSLSDQQLQDYLAQLAAGFESQNFIQVADLITAAIDNSRDAIVAAITGEPMDAAITRADDAVSAIIDRQSQSSEALSERIDGTNARLDSLTSAIIAAGENNTGAVVTALQEAQREAREERMIREIGIPRGRGVSEMLR